MIKVQLGIAVCLAAVLAGCAMGEHRRLPGCSNDAERRPINPGHWPVKATPAAPAVAPETPPVTVRRQRAAPVERLAPDSLGAPQTPQAGGAAAGGSPSPTSPTQGAPSVSPGSPSNEGKEPQSWWKRLLGAAGSPREGRPTWECEEQRA
jgi:hypothetical protein